MGDRVAIVDSATATAATLAELLSVNGLETPGTTRGTAADPGTAGHSRPTEAYGAPASHVQLTTGDVERFRSIASRMFGESFPDVEAVDAAGGRLMPGDGFRVRASGFAGVRTAGTGDGSRRNACGRSGSWSARSSGPR